MALDLRGELPTGALTRDELRAELRAAVRDVLREQATDVLVDDAGAADALGIQGPTSQHRARSFRARLDRGSLEGLAELAIGVGRTRRWRLSELRAYLSKANGEARAKRGGRGDLL